MSIYVRFEVYNTCAFIADTYFYKNLNPFLSPLSSLGKYIKKPWLVNIPISFFQSHIIHVNILMISFVL